MTEGTENVNELQLVVDAFSDVVHGLEDELAMLRQQQKDLVELLLTTRAWTLNVTKVNTRRRILITEVDGETEDTPPYFEVTEYERRVGNLMLVTFLASSETIDGALEKAKRFFESAHGTPYSSEVIPHMPFRE